MNKYKMKGWVENIDKWQKDETRGSSTTGASKETHAPR